MPPSNRPWRHLRCLAAPRLFSSRIHSTSQMRPCTLCRECSRQGRKEQWAYKCSMLAGQGACTQAKDAKAGARRGVRGGCIGCMQRGPAWRGPAWRHRHPTVTAMVAFCEAGRSGEHADVVRRLSRAHQALGELGQLFVEGQPVGQALCRREEKRAGRALWRAGALLCRRGEHSGWGASARHRLPGCSTQLSRLAFCATGAGRPVAGVD